MPHRLIYSLGTRYAKRNLAMQTPFPDSTKPATFFSRERRRQRMRKFVEAFERRSWRCSPEIPFLFPFAKNEVKEEGCSGVQLRP